MFKTAYETGAARQYDLKNVIKALQYSNTEGNVKPLKTPEGNKVVKNGWLLSPNDIETPPFNHPLWFENRNGSGYIVDSRFYANEVNGEIQIKDLGEHRFQVIRTILQIEWDANPIKILTLGDLTGLSFTRWIADSIARRLGMSPNDQMSIYMLTYTYWHSLFKTNPEFTEEEYLLIFRKLSQLTTIPVEVGVKQLETIQPMLGLEDYISNIKNVLTTVRTDYINLPLLYQMLTGSWFGINSREISAVSLEHPPTYCAMVLRAIENRTYQKAPLGKLVFDLDKANRSKILSKNIYQLIQDHTVPIAGKTYG